MTDRELMQKALGYMESVGQMDMHPEEWAIAVALRERLAQPADANPDPLHLSRILHELAGAASLCWTPHPSGVFDSQEAIKHVESAIAEIRERLAQPEQEPVAWLHIDSWGTLKLSQTMPPPVGAFPVYTAPQRREWVGLSEEEVKSLPQWFPSHETAAVLPLIRAIEAKLREKNA